MTIISSLPRPHLRSLITLALLGASASTLACTDADEHGCATDPNSAFYRNSVDVTERAMIASLEISTSGAPMFQLGEFLDFRYGAVYVQNQTGAPAWMMLHDDTNGTDTGWIAVPDCDSAAEDCHLWMLVSDTTDEVTASYSESATEPTAGTPATATQTVAIDDGPQPATHVAGNVVELNCSGVARFYDDGDGGPLRNYVNLMDSGTIEIANNSTSTTGTPPTYCVWRATPADPADVCPDWTSSDTYVWHQVQVDGKPLRVAPGGHVESGISADNVALGFTEAVGGSCPAAEPNPVFDRRQVIRIADTRGPQIRFENLDVESGDDTVVPAAIPFVLEVEDNTEITLVNCTSEVLDVDGFAPLNPAPMDFVDGQNPITYTFGGGANMCDETTAHWHWTLGGDPTMVIKKKADADCGG